MTDTEIPLFGLALTGAASRVYSIVSAAVNLYCGIGLYRANDLARRVTIGYQVFGILFMLYMPFSNMASQPPARAALAGIAAGGCALAVLVIWILVTKREGFVLSPQDQPDVASIE
ncbi:MAG: hypothetical protein HZB13_03625 [Acidobacteria bacterium]|nr:hypothetical protein [Acidobacteriota bacterium]